MLDRCERQLHYNTGLVWEPTEPPSGGETRQTGRGGSSCGGAAAQWPQTGLSSRILEKVIAAFPLGSEREGVSLPFASPSGELLEAQYVLRTTSRGTSHFRRE